MHIITWKAMHVIVCFHSIWTTAKIVTPNFNLFYFNQACGFFVTIVSGEILSHPACSKVNINTADSRVFVNKVDYIRNARAKHAHSLITADQTSRLQVCLCNRTPTRWCDQLSRYSFFFQSREYYLCIGIYYIMYINDVRV